MVQQLQRFIPLFARILIALPFIKFASDKIRNWNPVYEWMQYLDFPLPGLLLGLAIGIELIGGLCLIVGLRARLAALTMALYLIPVHVLIHGFWAVEAAERSAEMENFGKGMMIIGGLLFGFLHGPGPLSIDSRWGAGGPQED